MKNLVGPLFIILIFISSCGWFDMDREYSIIFKNNSIKGIETYFTRPIPDPLYPDTSLAVSKPDLLEILPNEKEYWYISFEYKYLFDAIPSDTLSVFIFSTDTLNKYTWEEVRDGYKILKRYDLSYDDLVEMDYTITYP
jgi:hypothetical protein